MKKLGKFLLCMGDIGYIGLGTTIAIFGVKIAKWAFNGLEDELEQEKDN